MVESTIPANFLAVCDRFATQPDKICYGRKAHGTWQTITHVALREDVECFAMGMMLLGVSVGERVGIVSENRVEWPIADFALAALGVIDVPIFPTLTGPQVAYIYHNCEAAAVIVSNQFQLNKLVKVRADIPSLRTIIVMNDDIELHDGVVRFSDVMERGRSAFDANTRRQKFIDLAAHVKPDDVLTLIYTSGTTGDPKGVMLTHRNITANVSGALASFDLHENDTLLSFLPLCHSYERMAGYYCAFIAGSSTYFAESIESVSENLREIRPTVMTSVPRLFERIKMRVLGNVEKQSMLQRKIFAWAVDVGGKWFRGERSVWLRAQHTLADKLVFAKVRERTGGRIRFFVSGGAALSVDVGAFFMMMGLEIIEGYGLTESSPVLCVNRLGEQELGTVGTPLPNVEIAIAADGEILARGPSIMKGYWKNDIATQEAIDAEGYLHTGDIGAFNERGHLRITDRKKHLLVSSGGKNIAPQPIEALLAESPLIDQVILIGDAREFCTALIVPDMEQVRALGIEPDALRDAIQRDLDARQRELPKYERARRFAVLSTPCTVENGLLTPTLKIKRKAVELAYRDVIDAMYAETEHEGRHGTH